MSLPKIDLSSTTVAGDDVFEVNSIGTLRVKTSSAIIDLYFKSPTGAWIQSVDYATGTAIQLTTATPEISLPPGTYSAVTSTGGGATDELWLDA